MLVVHSIERIENYMPIGLIIFEVLALALMLMVDLLRLYDCIYEYVCNQLDNCSYFGEDKQ